MVKVYRRSGSREIGRGALSRGCNAMEEAISLILIPVDQGSGFPRVEQLKCKDEESSSLIGRGQT